MTRKNTPITSDEIDDHIDLFSHQQGVAPSSGLQPPDARLIHDLQALHQLDPAVTSTLERVRQRLEQQSYSSAARVSDEAAPGRRHPSLVERLDHALRWSFEQIANSPIRTEELISRIRDEEQQLPLREEQIPPLLLVPAAPIHTPQRSPRRVFSWVAAIAAVLVIALITTALFASFHQAGGHVAYRGTSTATGAPPNPLGVYFETPFSVDQPHNSVVALNADDGSLLWRHDYSDAAVNVSVLHDGVLYAGSTNGYVYAFRASDGTVLWSRQIMVHTYVAAVVNGVVYLTADDETRSHPYGNEYTYALDAKTGAQLWHFAQGSVIGAVSNGLVYVENRQDQADRTLYALNASDGSVAWTYQGNLLVMLSVVDGIAYVTATQIVGSNMDPYSTLYALDAQRGTQLWSFPKGGAELDLVGAENGLTYLVSNDGQGNQSPNVLYALNTHDGSVQWRVISPAAGEVSSFVLTADAWYLGGGDNVVYALDAITGKQLWSTPLESGAIPSVVAEGRVYVSTQYPNAQNLYSLDASTGTAQWHTKILDVVSVQQAVNGVLYGGAADHSGTQGLHGAAYIYALNERDGSVKWRYPVEESQAGFFTPLIIG